MPMPSRMDSAHLPNRSRAAALAVVAACALAVIGVLSLAPEKASAASASSTNYRLQESVVNSFGGTTAAAGTTATSSGGEPFVGPAAGTSTRANAGFVSQLENAVELTVDFASVNLSVSADGTSQTAQSSVGVRADSAGYVLSASQNNDLRHTDSVTTIPAIAGSIAAPVAWVEGSTQGLGFALTSGTGLDAKWGTSPNFNFAAFPGGATAIHTKSNYQETFDYTVVRYRLAVSGTQKAGAYSNQVTYTATTRV